ncbi:MAG TPA: hypothetical protein VLB83_00605 [Candidatus Paceibacterota bacterium]|nr:hypothetical protein [Candidatus Paceibacterota bacterium]
MHAPRPLTPEQVASLVAHMGKMRMEGFTFNEFLAFMRLVWAMNGLALIDEKDVEIVQLAVAREEPDHN